MSFLKGSHFRTCSVFMLCNISTFLDDEVVIMILIVYVDTVLLSRTRILDCKLYT